MKNTTSKTLTAKQKEEIKQHLSIMLTEVILPDIEPALDRNLEDPSAEGKKAFIDNLTQAVMEQSSPPALLTYHKLFITQRFEPRPLLENSNMENVKEKEGYQTALGDVMKTFVKNAVNTLHLMDKPHYHEIETAGYNLKAHFAAQKALEQNYKIFEASLPGNIMEAVKRATLGLAYNSKFEPAVALQTGKAPDTQTRNQLFQAAAELTDSVKHMSEVIARHTVEEPHRLAQHESQKPVEAATQKGKVSDLKGKWEEKIAAEKNNPSSPSKGGRS